MSDTDDKTTSSQAEAPEAEAAHNCSEDETRPREYGGPRGKEPTRYGDWERKGRCIDF